MFNFSFDFFWSSIFISILAPIIVTVRAMAVEKTRAYIIDKIEVLMDYSLSKINYKAVYWWNFFQRKEQVVPLTKLVAWSMRPNHVQRTMSFLRMNWYNLFSSYFYLQLSADTLTLLQTSKPNSAILEPLSSNIDYIIAKVLNQDRQATAETYQEAKLRLDEALELNRDNLLAMNLLSEVEYELGDYKKSAHFLERLLHEDKVKENPNLDLVIRNKLFYVYRYQGLYKLIQSLYLNINVNNPKISKNVLGQHYNNIASLELYKGTYKKALVAIEKGLKLTNLSGGIDAILKKNVQSELGQLLTWNLGLYYYLSNKKNIVQSLIIYKQLLSFFELNGQNRFRVYNLLFSFAKLAVENNELDNAFKAIRDMEQLKIKYFQQNKLAEIMINYAKGNFYLSLNKSSTNLITENETKALSFFETGDKISKVDNIGLYLTGLLYRANLYYIVGKFSKSKKIFSYVLGQLQDFTESFESETLKRIEERIGIIDKILSKKNHPRDFKHLDEIVLIF